MTVTFTSRIGLDSVGPAAGQLILLFDEMQKAVRARDIADLLVGAFQRKALPENGQLSQGLYEAQVDLLVMSLSRVFVSHGKATSFLGFCKMVKKHSDEFQALKTADLNGFSKTIADQSDADVEWLNKSPEVAKLKAIRNQWLAHIDGGRDGPIPIAPLEWEELDLILTQGMERLNRYNQWLGNDKESFAKMRKEVREEFERLVRASN